MNGPFNRGDVIIHKTLTRQTVWLDRQTDRLTDRQTQTDRRIQTDRCTYMYIQTEQTERMADRNTNIHKDTV